MNINLLRERNGPAAFTVTELNNYIKSLFDSNGSLSSVTVKGEISNFVAHRSGHLYFSLKDSAGQIRAVMFRSSAARLKFMPESGMKVIVCGSVTVYPRDGSYQLYVTSMQPDGIGALYLAYEQLKERLMNEGLFDESNKKSIPKYPSKIGVITSPTGAAIRDILNVTARRYPLADIYLYPALVQGEGAEASLVRGVDLLDGRGEVDLIIIGRGGGSIEDLWAFNSEVLARRIFDAKTPIISAVGHEIDFTICDFVADLRAPTPSAAAELAVPDFKELFLRIDVISDRTSRALVRILERSSERLLRIKNSPFLKDYKKLFESRIFSLDELKKRADRGTEKLFKSNRERFVINAEKLNGLNPLSVLSRGYSVVEKDGKNLRDTDNLAIGDNVNITLKNGKFSATVSSVEKGSKK